MNYDFYADKKDKELILKYILNEMDLRVFDSYSPYGQEITEYKTVEEITEKLDLKNGREYAVSLILWNSNFSDKLIFERIELNPKKCDGHKFRYATRGWGTIQLYLGGLDKNRLHHSHIGHFNEKGALQNETKNHCNGKVGDWDWKEISKNSRKLKYYIHKKLATEIKGSFGILKFAHQLTKNGIELE